MKRKCVVCGKQLNITVNANKSYSGGYFFGVIQNDTSSEYWECEECYKKDWAE